LKKPVGLAHSRVQIISTIRRLGHEPGILNILADQFSGCQETRSAEMTLSDRFQLSKGLSRNFRK